MTSKGKTIIGISMMITTLVCSFALLNQTAMSVSKPANAMAMGANLDGVTDWGRCFAFNDLMKQARQFGTPDKPWEALRTLDIRGWPTTDFGVIFMADTGAIKKLGGVYKLSFECNGHPEIKLAANNGQVTHVVRSGSKITADVEMPEKVDQLMLSFRNTNGGARNIRLVRPNSHGQFFNEKYRQHIAQFGTIRFMDWGVTNGNKLEKWADRNTPDSPSWHNEKGVPYEVMADFANATKCDAWVCVPQHANENYITEMAKVFKEKLDPSLNLYIENSNEVWNWGFEQAGFNKDQAELEGPNDPTLSWDGKDNKWTWPARRIAKRLMKIRSIFVSAMGKNRVRPIFATQIVWPENWLDQGIAYIEHNHGAPKDFIYAIAGAPYFNLESLKGKKEFTKDEALKSLETSIDTMPEWGKAKHHQGVMAKHGLRWVCYEAGPDTFGPDSIAAKKASALDPKMRGLMMKFWRQWRGMGGGMMNQFVVGATNYDSQYGTWGLTDDMENTTAPKLLGIQDILNLKP
jgi:hypothetical protein